MYVVFFLACDMLGVISSLDMLAITSAGGMLGGIFALTVNG